MSVTYEQAHDAIAARLGETALAHCERVAETAGALALVYSVDVESARLAGLLHDWDRERSGDELLAAAEAARIPSPAETRTSPYLLHAHTGAQAVAEALPGIDGAVLAAIAAHTVGSPTMSDLDKVVWLADMLEPARDFDGVDDLREVVGTLSLDELFARAYQHSVAHLVATRRPIHPETVAVWNAMVAEVRS